MHDQQINSIFFNKESFDCSRSETAFYAHSSTDDNIRLAASFNQNIHFTLAAAVLTTCKTLVVEATSDIG